MIITAEILGGLFVYLCGARFVYAFRRGRFSRGDPEDVLPAVFWPAWLLYAFTGWAGSLGNMAKRRQEERIRIAEEEAIERKRILAELDEELESGLEDVFRPKGTIKVRRK